MAPNVRAEQRQRTDRGARRVTTLPLDHVPTWIPRIKIPSGAAFRRLAARPRATLQSPSSIHRHELCDGVRVSRESRIVRALRHVAVRTRVAS
jgi:hypothetical protein